MRTTTRLLDIIPVTHDVKCFRFEKPAGFRFTPGQATDVSVNKPGWENELRPFTFTALSDKPYLEFTIKRYADHHGVTDQLHQLNVGDELIIGDAWGAIEYKGPGYFIAGGAGITPFIAILRQLHKDGQLIGNTLFFSNKTATDIIYEDELLQMLGKNAVFTFTRETAPGFRNLRIDEQFLVDHVTDFKKQFYICGPDKMVSDLTQVLGTLGVAAEGLVFEQ
jgi:ferredoxin-NADP reductase